MKMYLNFTILLAFLTMLITSCESETNVISPDNNNINKSYEVSFIDDAGNKTIIESSKNGYLLEPVQSEIENDKIVLVDSDGNQFVINSSEKNALSDSLNSNGLVLRNYAPGMHSKSKIGYDLKQKIGNSKTGFTGYNPEYPNYQGDYLTNVVEFSFEVTVPANSKVLIPIVAAQVKTNIGYSDFTNNRFSPKGYSMKLMWSDQYCNIYKIYTVAHEITHNILGQQVTPTLYPKAVKNTDLLYFEYYLDIR